MRTLRPKYKFQTLLQHEEEIIDRPELSVFPKEVNALFNENGKRITTKTYTYNENFLCTEMKLQTGSDVYKCIYHYADNCSDPILQKMTDANMVGIPIASWSLKNGVPYQGLRTIYETFNELSVDGNTVICGISSEGDTTFREMVLPKYQLALNTKIATSDITTCAYGTVIVHNGYTRFGRIRDFNYQGTPISYIWSYKGTYPIAELKNATYQEFLGAYGNLNFDMIGGLDQDAMTHLRTQIWNGEIVCHGQTFSKISSGGIGGLYSGVNSVADAIGKSLVEILVIQLLDIMENTIGIQRMKKDLMEINMYQQLGLLKLVKE